MKNAVGNVFAMAQPWKKSFWKGQGGTEVCKKKRKLHDALTH